MYGLPSLRSLLGAALSSRRIAPKSRQHKRYRLELESLERREVLSTASVNAGVLTEFSTGKVTFSSDDKNLTGGGNTSTAYDGSTGKVSLTPIQGGGVLVQVAGTHKVFYSPDYKNL